jgi:hypothetical protein
MILKRHDSLGGKLQGNQLDYTDQAILMMLTVKEVFHHDQLWHGRFCTFLMTNDKTQLTPARSFTPI